MKTASPQLGWMTHSLARLLLNFGATAGSGATVGSSGGALPEPSSIARLLPGWWPLPFIASEDFSPCT